MGRTLYESRPASLPIPGNTGKRTGYTQVTPAVPTHVRRRVRHNEGRPVRVMNTSISNFVLPIVLGISEITAAGTPNTITTADYIAAIERYDVEAWASYDSVDRHEVTSGTDRGARLYMYSKAGNVQRLVFDYGLSQSDTLYCLFYKDGKLVKATQSRRRYHSSKDFVSRIHKQKPIEFTFEDLKLSVCRRKIRPAKQFDPIQLNKRRS